MADKDRRSTITFREIKHNQFLQAISVIAVFWLAWLLKYELLVIFIAFILTTAIYPLVALLKRHKVPTFLAVLLPLVGVVGLVTLISYFLLPPFVDKMASFAGELPHDINVISHKLHLSVNTSNLQSYLSRFNVSHVALTATREALTIAAGVLTILVITIYWLGSYETIKKEISGLFSGSTQRRVLDIWGRIELKMRHWLKAHLMLNTVVGVLVFIALTILSIPFASLFAFTAFLIEIIPTAGPVLAAAPAVLIGFTISPLKGMLVVIAYVIIQQVENHILSPMLLGRTVRLHPIVVIIALLVGVKFLGILGALIAVPLTLCLSAVIESYREPASRPVQK